MSKALKITDRKGLAHKLCNTAGVLKGYADLLSNKKMRFTEEKIGDIKDRCMRQCAETIEVLKNEF